jgi:23S rRNA (cytosine1962-C5)-methyltransferase
MPKEEFTTCLKLALEARALLLDTEHRAALRLFAGFYEGAPSKGVPNLVADLYAHTLVLFDYGDSSQEGEATLRQAQDFYLTQLPWIECVIQKQRSATDQSSRRGITTFGETPAQQIEEQGVIYAIDLTRHQDASFYLDTRNLRKWLIENAAGWQVFNTFAYTGSLGVAALAGGAARVIQTDRSKKFLALARQSAMLNRLDLSKMKLRSVDFFSEVARLKREGVLFNCVILDPPFFSSTSKGTVDLVNQSNRLINKVRPLIKDGGWLVAINNALFFSGAEYLQSLETLCQDGYLSIEEFIPIPEDITGFADTIVSQSPTDPSPFNHSTKIAILQVKRKI